MNVKNEICKSFNQHAADYEQAAKVQNEIGQRLFQRLDYLKMTPSYILDVGCGPGRFTALLKKKYPKAVVVGVDLAQAMLVEAKAKQRLWRKWPLVNADMLSLPFENGVFDLVFANQVIHWSDSLTPIFAELNRIMQINGCLMFSTLGPDTFKEIRKAWSGVNTYAHTNNFIDMHDIGDHLLREKFEDPVVDMEFLAVHYKSLTKLVHTIRAQGVKNINVKRNQGLTGKLAWRSFEANFKQLCTQEGKYPLTYEVVYGHAWKGQQRLTESGIETYIPIEKLIRKKI